MQLTCTVKKLFHLKCEIANAKILYFDPGAKVPGGSALGPTSLESPFDADVKVWYTCNATKHSFCSICDLLAVLWLQKSTPSHVDAQAFAIPGAISPNRRHV